MRGRVVRRLLLAAAIGLVAWLPGAHAAPVRRPYIQYLCAAGAQQGTTVTILAGGQNLRGSKRVLVSGGGVTGKVIRHRRAPWLLRSEHRQDVARLLRKLVAQKSNPRAADPRRRDRNRPKPQKQPQRKPTQKEPQKSDRVVPPIDLSQYPMLDSLEKLSLKELRRVMYEYLDPARRTQTSGQISEVVEIAITIAPDAAPGDRELRIGTPLGLTNPMLFQVGRIPEVMETEPNDYDSKLQPIVGTPCVINGQVSFKDLDRFRFRAKRGQKLVIEAQARRLVPYLADAVPGWFQATLAIYDSDGTEIRFRDDFRFDPDPVILFEPPADGVYVLEIRDAIHRGRIDFVYRITMAERPFITSIFPLGGRAGEQTIASVVGYNLPWEKVLLDTRFASPNARRMSWSQADARSNAVTYAVGELPECIENEPNDSAASAQRIDLPHVVNGRIDRPGDTDVFRFEGRAGDRIVAEILARRLGTALDSVLALTDASGRVITWNDDHADRRAGLVTHQADSHLMAELPADGPYFVKVTDAQAQGGVTCAYRLRVGPPRPDYAVIVTPASVNVAGGTHVPITVHAVRRDGFDGEIRLDLVDAPDGFALSGAMIPAGQDRVQMTLAAPPSKQPKTHALTLRARAQVERKTVRHDVLAAEDMMQAFGLRHLVQAERLLVDVTRSWRRAAPSRLADGEPVRLPVGASAATRILAPGLPPLDNVEFQLDGAPAGVTLRGVSAVRGGLLVELGAERGAAEAGLAGNLIVEAYAWTVPPKPRTGKNKPDPKEKAKPFQKRRYFVGVLPAIPFVIVTE